MALSLVNLGTPTSTNASPWNISVSLPSGVANGDLLIAHIQTTWSSVGTISAPAGWTQLGTQQQSASGTIAIFSKIRIGGETGPYTFSSTGTPYCLQGWINAVRSSTQQPWITAYAQANDGTSDTSCYIPAITMSSATVMLWGVVCLDRNDRWVDTAPSGYTLGNVYRHSPLGSNLPVGADAYRSYTGSNPPTTYFTANSSVTNSGFHYAIGEIPPPPSRVSQQANEVLVQPTTGKARVSQDAAEALVQPDTANARVSQQAIEVLVDLDHDVRVTEVHADIVTTDPNPDALVTAVWADLIIEQPNITSSPLRVIFID